MLSYRAALPLSPRFIARRSPGPWRRCLPCPARTTSRRFRPAAAVPAPRWPLQACLPAAPAVARLGPAVVREYVPAEASGRVDDVRPDVPAAPLEEFGHMAADRGRRLTGLPGDFVGQRAAQVRDCPRSAVFGPLLVFQ